MLIIYILCTITMFIIPLFKGMEANSCRFYDSKFRAYRLSLIQKHYPELRKLSWREIEREYPVRHLYDAIR